MTTTLTHGLAILAELCPAGYATGFHIRFTSPTYLFQTYAPEWNEYYSSQGLVMRDPTVAWMLQNTGAVRWSDLADQDAGGVLAAAKEHGLVYGASVSVMEGDSRSVGGFARADREFTDDELKALSTAMLTIHLATLDDGALSNEDKATIKRLSVTA
ncbi:MAG: autoinducer binding domain-containing protein [Pseudomonadota bacterium]